MTTLAGVLYEGPLPLDLRVRRPDPKDKQPRHDKRLSKAKSRKKSVASFETTLVEQGKELLMVQDSFIKFGIIKEEKDDDCFGLRTTETTHFEFQSVSHNSIEPGNNLYISNSTTDDVHGVKVKEEPEETDDAIDPLFIRADQSFSLSSDLAYLTKIEQENSSEEDSLIIDFNVEGSSAAKKRLNRSGSNCSSNSASSASSESHEEVRTFLLNSPKNEFFKLHRCVKCKTSFADLHSLLLHLEQHSSMNPGERFMPCPACTKRFGNIKGMACHIRKVHLGQMNFLCQWCGALFKFQYHQHKHESRCRKNKNKQSPDGR